MSREDEIQRLERTQDKVYKSAVVLLSISFVMTVVASVVLNKVFLIASIMTIFSAAIFAWDWGKAMERRRQALQPKEDVK